MPNRHARLEDPVALEQRLSRAVADERWRAQRDIEAHVLCHLDAMRDSLADIADVTGTEGEPSGSRVAHIRRALDGAIVELRATVSSAEPELVRRCGVGAALASADLAASGAAFVDDRLTRRHPPRVELTVYFCCREAVQNAAKHGGMSARATIRLEDDADGVRFAVTDDGVGFDTLDVQCGAGLGNIRERIEAAGGRVLISSVPGTGTVVSGFVPDQLVSDCEPFADTEGPLAQQLRLERESEQRRIMRDLHDGAQQSLVALRVRLGLAIELATPGSMSAELFGVLAAQLDLAIAGLRDLARTLLVRRSIVVEPAFRAGDVAAAGSDALAVRGAS